MNRLVGEHRHLAAKAVRAMNRRQALPDGLVDMGVVEFVDAVVSEEIVQSRFQELLVFGVAQGSPHQHRSSIPYVRSNQLIRQLRTAKMPQHSVDRMYQVEP